ncbi:hypothetical protein B0H13DRAFT_1895561 [Mycena leptocephala]|nr:hypothetical protein B0H13DRAFT_1895561 [Mycena leptocephala]
MSSTKLRRFLLPYFSPLLSTLAPYAPCAVGSAAVSKEGTSTGTAGVTCSAMVEARGVYPFCAMVRARLAAAVLVLQGLAGGKKVVVRGRCGMLVARRGRWQIVDVVEGVRRGPLLVDATERVRRPLFVYIVQVVVGLVVLLGIALHLHSA